MTGGGRCRRRRKTMTGGRGAAERKKIDGNLNIPNLKTEITEKPSTSLRTTKLPQAPSVDFFDLYTQARKALSFTSPFDAEDSQSRQAIVSSAPALPSGVSHLLGRPSDGRKRRKKLHSGSDKKSSTPGKIREINVWVETEDYFRDLNVEDIETLDTISSFESSSNEKCFLTPFLNDDDKLHDHYSKVNRMLTSVCKKDSLNLVNSVEFNAIGKLECDDAIAQEGNKPQAMVVDGVNNGTKESELKGDNNGEKRVGVGKDCRSFSGVEWLLGSRSKIYLTSERPSKKRRLLGRDAGLEKLLVARPVENSESLCHYCSYGDMGDPLNFLIRCSSCGMMVHQRCYGVQEDGDNSWLCSWCRWKNVVDLRTETPCLLCPKRAGAMKPMQKQCFGSENEGSKMEFAHLFCCQWLPEVYLENTRTMEPIMNMDEFDRRKKLICYLCKVKYGACVRCSNGSCRTSFHPICAREAQHRMEIWGKLGSDEVELRAFCSKHSKVQSGTKKISLTADFDTSKQNHMVFDGDELLENRRNSEPHLENKIASHPAAALLEDTKINNVNSCTARNFNIILKKLIELGKVNAKDVASEIGVSPDCLNTILTDNHMVPESQYKLLKWLKNHAHIGSLQNALEVKIRSFMTPKAEADSSECDGAVSVEESGISDAVPVKPVPPRRRTKRNLRTMKDDKPYSSKDKNNDETPAADVDLCLIMEEDSNTPSGELVDKSQKTSIDSQSRKDNLARCSSRIEDQVTALSQCLSDGLVDEGNPEHDMTTTVSFGLVIGDVSMQTNIESLEKTASHSAVLVDRDASQLEAFSSSDLCCNNNVPATSGDWASKWDGVNRDWLLRAKDLDMLKLSPSDEVEGELMYYQQRLLYNATARKCKSDGLISKVVRNLPKEIDTSRERTWDTVSVSQYIHGLREAKKRGRKERRQKESQAVVATATAAAAGSSRMSSIRKDALDKSSQQDILNLKVKQTIRRLAVVRSKFDTNTDSVQLASTFTKLDPRICDICRHSETVRNPILLCSSCKVAVHVDCYCSVKSTEIPWRCELCEDLFSSLGSGARTSCENPSLVAKCGLCGGNAGAFRKSVNGEWIHAYCAEVNVGSRVNIQKGANEPCRGNGKCIYLLQTQSVLVLDGQSNGLTFIIVQDTIGKGDNTCFLCNGKQGVCLKCSYGHCQTKFHPTCARSSDLYMIVKTDGSKLQHKAYCKKHSKEQRAKAGIQRHGIEEFRSLKQVRVELDRLRLLCERIIKREKLKRELVLCSHDLLATRRDSVLSALARHPFYQPEFSSESATTSVRGFTDSLRSGSEMVQRSDDITVDSTVACRKRFKLPTSMDNDDSSTSQSLCTLKPPERVSLSGKQIPQRANTARILPDSMEKQSKYREHGNTFEKDQASQKNQRLPKGFVRIPIRYPSKDKKMVPDACSEEPADQNG